eukprot:CAMPEP_0197735286 /NCGR_PEP_ID=MMETSP1435-20131217/510_1 /TAXON_ID=426625 /ORGANISM="Chaetoceros brevis, Strain CCMP164" /LENGTH=43 /DNA_ID= /DNA_START= /DNA_END= /DNA_ORIENTATION=
MATAPEAAAWQRQRQRQRQIISAAEAVAAASQLHHSDGMRRQR